MKRRAQFDLGRRLGRLEWLTGEIPGEIRGLRDGNDHVTDWLSGEEFAELVELMQEQPVEAEECQTLLRRAWGRRARREPRAGDMWRVLFDEGRTAEAEEEMRRRRAWGLDRP